jgi:hypothetical protein
LPHDGQVKHPEEVDTQFFKTCGDATQLFEPADALFDDVALAVSFFVEDHVRIVIGFLIFLVRDHRFDVPLPQPVADGLAAVALVAGKLPGLASSAMLSTGDEARHQGLQPLLLADLPGGDVDRQWNSLAVSKNVELGSKPAF